MHRRRLDGWKKLYFDPQSNRPVRRVDLGMRAFIHQGEYRSDEPFHTVRPNRKARPLVLYELTRPGTALP